MSESEIWMAGLMLLCPVIAFILAWNMGMKHMWHQEETSWSRATREEHESVMKSLRHYGGRYGAVLFVLLGSSPAWSQTYQERQMQLDRMEQMLRQQRADQFDQQMQTRPAVPYSGNNYGGMGMSQSDRDVLMQQQQDSLRMQRLIQQGQGR